MFLVFFQWFFSSCAGGRGSYPDFHTSPAKLPKFLTGFQINYTSQIALLVFPLNFFSFVFICHNKIKEFIIKHTHDNNIGTILLSLTCLTSVAKEQSVKEKDKDERETLIFQLEIAALVILWLWAAGKTYNAVIFILVWGLQYFLCKLFIGARSRIDISETLVCT